MIKAVKVIVLGLPLILAGRSALASFTTISIATVSASVSVTGAALSIQATPLPGQAFFGKNVIIPVGVTSSAGVINPAGLQVKIFYSLYDKSGNTTGLGLVSVPITLARDPTRTNTLIGSAIIPRADLQPIQQGGRIDYMFQAIQNGAGSVRGFHGPASGPGSPLTSLPDPYQTTIIDQWCSPVGPAGARVSAPDLFVHDGQTAVTLGPGVVSAPGTLCLKQEDTDGWPTGPGGTKPAAVCSVTLNDTSLNQTAELVLSYPADVNGKVLNLDVSGNDLGIYWLGPEGLPLSDQAWRVLSRAQVDTTLHTVTGFTAHFSTFALFPVGAISAADIRPMERIITPNGDGINDTATFSGLTSQEEVHIFDIRGRRVRTIRGPSPVWDGKDDDGGIVESGVYIYQYTSGGDRVSGVIGVAK